METIELSQAMQNLATQNNLDAFVGILNNTAAKIEKQQSAEVLGGLLPLASETNDGLMSANDSKTITKSKGITVDDFKLEDLPIGMSYIRSNSQINMPKPSGCIVRFNYFGTSIYYGWFPNVGFCFRCYRDGNDTGWEKLSTTKI